MLLWCMLESSPGRVLWGKTCPAGSSLCASNTSLFFFLLASSKNWQKCAHTKIKTSHDMPKYKCVNYIYPNFMSSEHEMEMKPILLLHWYLFSLFCLILWFLCLVSEASDLSLLLFSRLVVSGVGGPGLLAVFAPDRYLLVSVLPSHLLLLRQMPLLPGALLLSPRLWVHTSFTSTSTFSGKCVKEKCSKFPFVWIVFFIRAVK